MMFSDFVSIKNGRYGIYMIHIDDGWLVKLGGERKRFVIGFKTMQFLGFTRFGYALKPDHGATDSITLQRNA